MSACSRLSIALAAVVLSIPLFARAVLAQDEPSALEENENYSSFKSWATNTQYPDPVPNMFKFCIEAYDRMIASGVSPDTRVPDEEIPGYAYGDPPLQWTGTIEEIKRNWCEAGLKQKSGEVATLLAPYKAALRNDKLELVINETHGQVSSYALPGGRYTDDPAALAAAPVWFLDLGAPSNEVQNCLNGALRKIVRRYEFDGDHKLLGTSSKEYCGDPPAEAYR